VQKGAWLCQSLVELELKLLHASSQENPHVDLVQQPTIEVSLAQRVVAKGVERSDERGLLKARHFFSDAAFHFPRRLLREGQGENVFGLHAFRVLQQVDNAMGDDARLAAAWSRNDQQRALAMFHRSSLLRVKVRRVGHYDIILPRFAPRQGKWLQL